MNDDLPISSEFIQENKEPCQSIPKKRNAGPYSKTEKDLRRNEVHRLHFEYGYSARRIAELMHVNRNTINGDLNYWHSRIAQNISIINPEFVIVKTLQRLEIQRTRLREQLDKTDFFQEKLTLERYMFDIDSKILYTYHRLAESSRRLLDLSAEHMNKWMKDNDREERYITLFDKISVSEKARKRINEIINEDRKQGKYI